MSEPQPAGTVEGAISAVVPDVPQTEAAAPPTDAPTDAPPPDAPTVSLVDDPEAQAVTAPPVPEVPATETEPAVPAVPERVLVSPSDPVLGAAVARWLEGAAAREAKLSPLVERLGFLENVYLAFPADDPIFEVPVPEPAPAQAPAEPTPA